MQLTHKERVRRAVRHERVDRLPTQINYTGRQAARMAAHFGVTTKELPALLDNHLQRLDLTYVERYNEDRTVKFDWWGAGFDTGEEGYFVRVSPLQENPDLDAFDWPDPHTPGLLDDVEQIIADDAGEHFLMPNFGWSLFERAWSLRGMVEFFMDMAGKPDYAGDLLDRITDIQLVLIKRFIALGVDGGYFGDDYGGQVNMLISPQMWRTLIKPRLARLFTPFREAGLPILMHSDGHIEPILPDLVEIGLNVYNPVQPEVCDFGWLHSTFGDRLAYYGGVSTQSTMPFGTPADVRADVVKAMRELAPENTGLILAPSHRMMSDIPMANVEALLAAFTALDEDGGRAVGQAPGSDTR
jgi:uroporphyrinogen decarboxylase